MKYNETKMVIVWVLAIILFWGCCYCMSSCKVLKKERLEVHDSTAVTKTDTGRVAKQDVSSLKENEWWRNTMYYPTPTNFDTSKLHVTNNIFPAQPAIIIQEGGRNKEETHQTNYDSIWSARLDSLVVVMTTRDTSVKTEVLSPFQIIAICLGGAVLLNLLSHLFSNFKIVKK